MLLLEVRGYGSKGEIGLMVLRGDLPLLLA